MATAIKNMTGVSITSPYFSDSTTLELFPKHSKPPKNNRISLIYGKNGSGKSTIAQGFREYRDSVSPRTVTLKPVDGSSEIDNSTSGKQEKFFVFDEEYISSRVRIKNSGLDAIVLFGKQVELDEQILKIEQKLDANEAEIEMQETEYSRFNDNCDVNSPMYWSSQIRNKLRENNGWAEVGSKIKGQRQNLTVNDAEIERIGIISPTRTLTDLQREFYKLYDQFSEVGVGSTSLSTAIKMVFIVRDIEVNSKSLLVKIVDRPKLTEREQKLLNLFGIANVVKAKSFFSDSKLDYCTSCLQPISDDYRSGVLKEIECILNQDFEDFKVELEKLILEGISIDTYESYQNLSSYNDAYNSIIKYNQAVIAHNKIVQSKLDNPFESLDYSDSIGIIKACDSVNKALTALEVDRINFNRIVNERAAVMTELLTLNEVIAHYTIESMFESLTAQRAAKQTSHKKLQELIDYSKELQEEKTKLDSQRKSFHIAADEINNSLEYIFFCNGRLSLVLGDDQVYHLKSNGNPVNPNKVSSGERNALALSYFFTEIAKEMDVDAKYSDEVFLIIDDPISSFDLENRIGMLSLLRWKLGKILESCATSKVLMMTHDIGVMLNLDKALKEISKHCERASKHADHKLFQLESKCLKEFEYNGHEYSQLLRKIYNFASSTTLDFDSDLVIGNVIRRVLEAFSSFSFKKGISDISLDEQVLDLLDDEESKTYYRNLMYRVVLDNESHFKENIQGAPEMSFFSYLSLADKKRTAKDILCFMYRLNRTHIISHLPDAESDLVAWCANLKGKAVS